MFSTCTWFCMGLDGSTLLEFLPAVTCDFDPPEHVPRTSVRARICAVVFGWAPCVHRGREHEKRPAAKCRCTETTYVYITQRFPFGMCLTLIPGVTQDDEKGHEGDTAIVTAYLCLWTHGQRERTTGVSADYSTIVCFEHDINLVQQSCWLLLVIGDNEARPQYLQ